MRLGWGGLREAIVSLCSLSLARAHEERWFQHMTPAARRASNCVTAMYFVAPWAVVYELR